MTTPPTIFISPYRNVSIRYILYSDIFKEQKRKDVRIVLFLKDNDLEYYGRRLGGENVILEPIFWDTASPTEEEPHSNRGGVVATYEFSEINQVAVMASQRQ